MNDAFVMDAWGKSVGADDKVLMLADGSAKFAKVPPCSKSTYNMNPIFEAQNEPLLMEVQCAFICLRSDS